MRSGVFVFLMRSAGRRRAAAARRDSSSSRRQQSPNMEGFCAPETHMAAGNRCRSPIRRAVSIRLCSWLVGHNFNFKGICSETRAQSGRASWGFVRNMLEDHNSYRSHQTFNCILSLFFLVVLHIFWLIVQPDVRLVFESVLKAGISLEPCSKSVVSALRRSTITVCNFFLSCLFFFFYFFFTCQSQTDI